MNACTSLLLACSTLFALFALGATRDVENPLPASFDNKPKDFVMSGINHQDPVSQILALKYKCSDKYFRKPKNCKRNGKLLKLTPKLRNKMRAISMPSRHYETWE